MNANAAALGDIETLYTTHAAWLRRWLMRRTRCSQQAADLAQDTFCKLIEAGAGIAVRDPRPYMVTVARRLLIDDARRRRVEAAFLDAHAVVLAGAMEASPEQVAAAVDELTAIALVLEALPDRVRRAFLLSRIEGLGHAEIAAELGVSKSMIKQYVARAYAHCYALAYGAPHP